MRELVYIYDIYLNGLDILLVKDVSLFQPLICLSKVRLNHLSRINRIVFTNYIQHTLDHINHLNILRKPSDEVNTSKI